MTSPLFPSTADRRGRTVPADRDEPRGRWVLHRAGIVNVWQYDRIELHFAGGRLLLRGKNGAGKSKALEILLPFLFDGDTRLLDATGRDRTTVAWLMTDGRPNGNHVGYVWLELRCLDPDGGESFLTLGAGLKASTATRRSDSWYFMTPRRVGVDLALDVAGECVSIERLKEVLGEDAVTASGVEHRRRVGRQVFGLFDEVRYRNLLHLVHRLRDPNIGNRVEAGELATVLGDALPPIDERVLAEAAAHFDDLDAIREQVDRSTRTASALGQFLGVYRGYARTVLARRAARVEQAEAHRARLARAARQLERTADEADAAMNRAHEALGAHRRARTEAEAERRELERSQSYRAHQDLVDRRERVAALDLAAGAADEAASRARAAHGRACADLDEASAQARTSLIALDEAAAGVAGLAGAIGFETTLVGPSPVPTGGGDLDLADLARRGQRAEAARSRVDHRRRRATEVRALAGRAATAEHDALGAEERAAGSEAEVERERAAVGAARAAERAAEQAWAEAVATWTTTGVAGSAGIGWEAVLARLAARTGDPSWVAAVRAAVADALAPVRERARAAAATADLAVAGARDALNDAEARLAAAEAEPEARPVPAPHREAERDPSAGAPFYELVDVAAHVQPAQGAALEAALEAAGILDAWVWADGRVVHPDTRDVVLHADTPHPSPGTATLAEVLVPAVAPAGGSPVAAATVAAILRAVGLGERADGAAWVTTDGRWALGVLRGAWGKERVEYLGAAARRATRARAIAELRRALDARRDDLAAAGSRAQAAARRRDDLEALPMSLPSPDSVEEAASEVRAADRTLVAVRARHDGDRRRAEAMRGTANRALAEVASVAAADGLPTGVAQLDDVLSGLADLRDALADHRRAHRDLVRDHERRLRVRAGVTDSEAELATATATATTHRARHGTAAHELAALQDALSATVDAVLAQHAQVTARLAELDDVVIPSDERARRDADAAAAAARVRREGAARDEAAAGAQVVEAGGALERAVVLPGVVQAAAGSVVQHPAELVAPQDRTDPARAAVALAAVVAPLVQGDDEVSDGVVLSRYDRLSDALAGGYDTAIDETDGVKVVHVADDTGRQPLATVAARLADEADAARGRLAAREREVLERFLLRELADEIRSKLLDAHDLVTGTNRTLSAVRTSHGKGAHLDWALTDDAAAAAGTAARLLVDGLRDAEADAQLRGALLTLIDAERASDPSAGYEQHLRAALDYRAWYRFTVKVTDVAQPGSSRTLSNRLGLSQGEQRVLSYLALFAAAASHFDAIARDTPTAPRLLLLDDAFAKVDEPTHAHLLGLLVDLGLDFVLTSERMWGCFPSVPSLEIYEAVRDPAHPGVALVRFRWDGHARHLVGV